MQLSNNVFYYAVPCSYSKISQSSANSDIIKWIFAALSWHHKLSEWVCSVWVKKLQYKYQNFIFILILWKWWRWLLQKEKKWAVSFCDRKSDINVLLILSKLCMTEDVRRERERTFCIVTWTFEVKKSLLLENITYYLKEIARTSSVNATFPLILNWCMYDVHKGNLPYLHLKSVFDKTQLHAVFRWGDSNIRTLVVYPINFIF